MAQRKEPQIDKTVKERLSTYEDRRKEYETRLAKKRRLNFIVLTSMVAVVVLAIAAGIITLIVAPPSDQASEPLGTPTNAANVPDPALSENRTWTGSMTVGGVPLTFELDGISAPQAVASTIYLAQTGFYEGLTCHRLTTAGPYVLQCGDPQADGFGGPGYYYGPIENDPVDGVYPAGTIAMARQKSNPTSMGSQFFIVYEDSEIEGDVNGGYSVIGHITSGLDQLKAEVTSAGTADGSSDGAPALPVTLTSISVQ